MALDPFIQQIEEALPAFLLQRRWYRAKALPIMGLRVHDIIVAGAFLILIVRVEYESAPAALYVVPVQSSAGEVQDGITTFESPTGETVTLHDAVSEEMFRRVLLRALISGVTWAGTKGELVAEPSLRIASSESPAISESKVSRAEQSNTSIIYGDTYILKLFRRIEAGVNPDIEIGAFLTARGFMNTPSVLGTMEYRAPSGEHYAAGILQEFVPNQGDAWKYTLDSLAGFYDRVSGRSPDPVTDAPGSSEFMELLGSFSVSAALLGTRTAQMHIALASGTHPDFAPEAFTPLDARGLALEISEQADSTFQLLRPHADELSQRVLAVESEIRSRIEALPQLSTSALRIRHHGDYHLGQVLYTGSDFMIIDFEGEPARPLAERRAKALALRDVAGMLRSFQYAAYAALGEGHAELSAWSELWTQAVSDLYLDAYYHETTQQRFLPESEAERSALLNAFLLQKALYELAYELNNRPTWAAIPLRGILSLFHQNV